MNPITDPLVGPKARQKVLAGVNKVYNAIRPTLGPSGRAALLPRSYNRGPKIVDDGYHTAENVQLKDEHERLAADAFKEGIKRTNELVGDGTTGTGVISGFLINRVLGALNEDAIPSASLEGVAPEKKTVIEYQKEMKEAATLVVEEIKKRAKPVKDLKELEKIAFISIKDEAAAKTVAKMVWELGTDNYIDVTEGYKGEIETEVIKGMRFPAKVAAKAFVTKPERHEMIAEEVPVFITNYKLDNPYQVVDILNKLKKPKIALIAPEFSPNVLITLVQTTKNGMFVFPVAAPALRTEQMEDVAVYTGATLINKDAGRSLASVELTDLGYAERIVVKETEHKEDAILIGGKGEKIKRSEGSMVDDRVKVLKAQLAESKNDLEKHSLQRRIANLASAVGVIRVGSPTDKESTYLKLKVEDGVFACKAALLEGQVKGGGLCLKEIAETLPESILTEALKEPYALIQKNAGGKLEIGKDVIDPAKVIRLEVEHAVSIASTMIAIDISIPELREKSPAEGYEQIAKAIVYFGRQYAKHHGLIKENADFEADMLEKEFEKAMHNDLG